MYLGRTVSFPFSNLGNSVMPYTAEQFQYFEQLIRGEADISWRAWWKRNEATLKVQLPRAEYLRIKFGLIEYAFKLLQEAGGDIEWGPAASREHYYARLHESVLDEKGRPSAEFQRQKYQGALRDLKAGDQEKAQRKMKRIIRQALKNREEYECEELCDIQFDGAQMLASGIDDEIKLGLALTREIASLDDTDDIIGVPIRYARDALAKYEGT